MKASGENRGNPHLMRFRVWCKNRLIVMKAKGYLKSCHGNCVPKFSSSEVTNMTFEEERGNPH